MVFFLAGQVAGGCCVENSPDVLEKEYYGSLIYSRLLPANLTKCSRKQKTVTGIIASHAFLGHARDIFYN